MDEEAGNGLKLEKTHQFFKSGGGVHMFAESRQKLNTNSSICQWVVRNVVCVS